MPPTKVKPTIETKPEIITVNKVKATSSIYLVNPFSGDRFLPGEEIEATIDNWLECQIAAGLVRC
jgi:hypothetical protein